MMNKLMETKIPDLYSRGLEDEKGIAIPAVHVSKIADVIFTAVSECLHDLKSKNKPAAFVFEDLVGETIASAVVEYHKSEDETQPGNWSYIWSFDNIVPEEATVLKVTDMLTHSFFVNAAASKYRFGYEADSYIAETSNYFLKTISKYLTDNASTTEQNGVEMDNVFQAKVAIEDGEVVKSIEVIGETKALIKDDSDVEILK